MATATDLERPVFYDPPTIAKMLGIDAGKVRALIRSGELRASNLVLNPVGHRPKYRVSAADLQDFLDRRASNEGLAGATA